MKSYSLKRLTGNDGNCLYARIVPYTLAFLQHDDGESHKNVFCGDYGLDPPRAPVRRQDTIHMMARGVNGYLEMPHGERKIA